MYTLISIAVAVMITIGCGLLLMLFFGKLIMILLDKLFKPGYDKRAVKASAIILEVQQKAVLNNSKIRALIQLQVKPLKGRNFVTEIDGYFSAQEYQTIKPGMQVNVYYNPKNFRQLVLLPFANQSLPLAG